MISILKLKHFPSLIVLLLSLTTLSKNAVLDSPDFMQLGFQDPATPLMEVIRLQRKGWQFESVIA